MKKLIFSGLLTLTMGFAYANITINEKEIKTEMVVEEAMNGFERSTSFTDVKYNAGNIEKEEDVEISEAESGAGCKIAGNVAKVIASLFGAKDSVATGIGSVVEGLCEVLF